MRAKSYGLALTICVANFTNRFNDALELVPDLGV